MGFDRLFAERARDRGGIVATKISQAIFSSAVWIDRRATERNQAATKWTISSQK
jgi:hypothetical protein